MLKVTAKGRVLRGTALDPFGRAHVRKVERELKASHTALVERLTASLTAETYAARPSPRLVRPSWSAATRRSSWATSQRYREALGDVGPVAGPSGGATVSTESRRP